VEKRRQIIAPRRAMFDADRIAPSHNAFDFSFLRKKEETTTVDVPSLMSSADKTALVG